MTYELSDDRADSLKSELQTDLGDNNNAFEYVFLVDDFAGSGTTILRGTTRSHLMARLPQFVKYTLPKLSGATCPRIIIALYLATTQAIEHIRDKITSYPNPPWTAQNCPEVTVLMELDDQTRLCHGRHDPEYKTDQLFDTILHRYYDPQIEDEHKRNVVHGYSDCGLVLILSHNTPNNSVYLLWAQSHTQPLFPRVERHQSHILDNS